ncbi:hypothetical protein AAIO74_24230 (plasmid) [Escherichia coli]|uniref:hypothetical protein n=1 Tax=Escherichia coli TaxID=562 RepID=UPI003D78DD67
MLKLELIILPLLAFLGPSNITNASTKTPIPSSQLSDAKTGVNYEFITIAANYVNGMWLVDGRQRPVIKTSMTKRNYLQIENDSASTPLNLVIPKIEFSIIAKNGVFISKFISLDEDASGKRILWLEPGSSMTISFVNDLSSTPLQALVSVTKQKKEVIAIFGPDQGKKFTLPLPSDSQQSSIDYVPSPEIALRINAPKKLQPAIAIPEDASASLLPSHTYKIRAAEKVRTFKFSSFVWVGKRNNLLGGSDYFTKELKIYPRENFDISTIQKTTMRTEND